MPWRFLTWRRCSVISPESAGALFFLWLAGLSAFATDRVDRSEIPSFDPNFELRCHADQTRPNENWQLHRCQATPGDNLTSDMSLTNESNTGFSLASDPAFGGSINWKNQNMTIDGTGVVTLNLRNFKLNDSTLTLDGTAATQFVIDVQHRFSLTDVSSIVLSGGIQPLHVVFNISGRGNVLIDDQSALIGAITAGNRTVTVSDQSTVTGTVTAASTKLVNGGDIDPPPVVSP